MESLPMVLGIMTVELVSLSSRSILYRCRKEWEQFGLGTLAFLGVFFCADASTETAGAGIGGIEGGDKLMEKMGSMDAVL